MSRTGQSPSGRGGAGPAPIPRHHGRAKRSGLESLPEGTISDNEVLRRVIDQLATAATRGRTSVDRLDGTDKVSEDILIEVVEGLEKHLWIFRSQQA